MSHEVVYQIILDCRDEKRFEKKPDRYKQKK